MGALFSAGPDLRYPERLRRMRAAGIGLWDVLRHCDRETSLDVDIKRPDPNNFRRLFRACPRIHTVFFNGTKAESLFRSLVLADLPERLSSIRYVGLPSTSPANTSMSFKEKKRRWMRLSFWFIALRLSNRPPVPMSEWLSSMPRSKRSVGFV